MTKIQVITGELCGVYCEDLGENWPRYNGTALYIFLPEFEQLRGMTKIQVKLRK